MVELLHLFAENGLASTNGRPGRRASGFVQVGQRPATPRQIHRAILRPLLTCGSLIDKFCLTPQAPLFNIGRF
jgi:hypothetical protein